MRHAAQSQPSASPQSLIGGLRPALGLIEGPAPHLTALGGPASQAALAKTLAALNRDYTPALSHFNRETAKVLAPFNREMSQRLADMVKLPVAQIINDAAVLAPFHDAMQKQVAETLSKLTPITARLAADIAPPMSDRLLQQLAELAAIAAPFVPDMVAEKIEQASQEVSNARPRTPEELATYSTLCTNLLTLIMTIIQICLMTSGSLTPPATVGGTVNIINNSPTHVTNVTTVVIQPPAPVRGPEG